MACNSNIVTLVSNPLSCIKCDSTNTPNCINLQLIESATQCNVIASGFTDSCYTHVANGTIQRGCMSEKIEFETVCQNADICETCSSSGCNTKEIESETCYECDSEEDANCRTELSPTMQTTCPLSVRKMGCYQFDDGG